MTGALNRAEGAKLREFLVRHFSLSEQKDLAFDLGVSYEVLAHDTASDLARELIAYCERRGQLSCLVAEVLKRRDDSDLARLLITLPPCLPSKKIVILLADDLLEVEDVSACIEGLAASLGISGDEIHIMALAQGSLRLLVALPEHVTNVHTLWKIHSLGKGKHPIAAVDLLDPLDLASQRAWRFLACDVPPIHGHDVLRPAVSWTQALELTQDTPVVRLAELVLKGKLSLEKALQEATTPETLATVTAAAIDRLDESIRGLDGLALARATVLAILNCQAAQHVGNNLTRGDCHYTLGSLYLQQDEWEPALHHYREALRIFEPMPEVRDITGQIRYDVGQIWERQDRFEAAMDEYRQALRLAEGRFPQLESDAWSGLGRVDLAQERAEDALAAFECALAISRACADLRGQEAALSNRGQAHHFLGRLAEAEKDYREAIALSQKTGHWAGTGRLWSSLGNVLIEWGRLDEAEKLLQDALESARQYHDHRGEQQRLGNLGNLYQAKARRESDPRRSQGWLSQAADCHNQALSIARARNDRRSQSEHLINLGSACHRLGYLEEAQAHYREALSLAREQRALDTQWRIHYGWGDLCATQRWDREAFRHYATAIQAVEKQRQQLHVESRVKFWQERATLYRHMVLCCLRLNRLWSALEYTERAKARYLADLLAQGAPPAGNTQEVIRAALEALPPRTAAVVFNVAESGTLVFIATAQPMEGEGPSVDSRWQRSPDGHIRARLIEEFKRDTLQDILVQSGGSSQATGGYLVDYYANRKRWMDSTLESACAQVYQCLLAPVHQELARLPVERIVLMPNLGLSLLPLHACHEKNGTGRDYLLDRYEISYVPSFDVLRHCQVQVRPELPGGRSLFAVANPTGDLAWAGVEVERIAGLFPEARILGGGEGNRATRASVIAQAPGYAYAHFACHGEFNLREPLQSALRLAKPDLLTLETMLKGPPSAQANPDTASTGLELPCTRLVVLSACETGLVDPGDQADEYVGLPSGFIHAGVPTVVSSLWRVDDLSTALLMEEFYRRHLVERKGAAEALRGAQRWLRDLKRDELLARVTAVYDAAAARIRPNGGDPCSTPWLKDLDKWRKYWERLRPEDCPLAHPYYWAAFTASGAFASQARL